MLIGALEELAERGELRSVGDDGLLQEAA
jgi:hypothetical protein